jgi:HEPN domain-containing protein
MSLPHAEEAREFYQAAKQRLADSYLLLDHGRTTGSMYLAGYAVECMLKALVLSALPRRHRAGMIGAWIQRGKGHDLEWLKRRYNQLGGPGLPSDIKGRLMLVNTWSTSWR